jgi:serine protease Do
MQRSLIALCIAACVIQAAVAQKTAPLPELSSALERLAAAVAPAVVQVQVSGWCGAGATGAEDASTFSPCRVIGSGVIVDPSGYIMTNEHVVRNARRIRVMLTPKSEVSSVRPVGPRALDPVIMYSNSEPMGKREILDAVVVGATREADLALLKIQATGLPAVPLQQTGTPRQGQLVLAIGSPEGLDNTMTIGIVSAVGRQPHPDYPMLYIQTDAAINPGNSGGPLLNVQGELIGINTFIINESGRNQGLGFAVPAAVVRYVYEQLRTQGIVRYCLVGLRVQTVTPGLAQGLGLSRGYGVMIADVLPRSSADSAGLRPRDIIASIDGAPISTLLSTTR